MTDLASRQPAPTTDYLLGADPAEQARLDLQAAYYRAATVEAMRAAGLAPGMRVLDLGSGTGAVAVEAAHLVGPTGRVLGLDSSADVLATARRTVDRLGLGHVRFQETDLAAWAATATDNFDAITGRLISMYLPDAPATLAALARRLRPGGVVLLQEFSISSAQSVPETPQFRHTLDCVLAAFRAAGIPTDLGRELAPLFRAAGLPRPTMIIGGRFEHGPDAVAYAMLAEVARTLAPVIVGRGIASASQLDLESLEDRLRAEALAADASVSASLLISAWARMPG